MYIHELVPQFLRYRFENFLFSDLNQDKYLFIPFSTIRNALEKGIIVRVQPKLPFIVFMISIWSFKILGLLGCPVDVEIYVILNDIKVCWT